MMDPIATTVTRGFGTMRISALEQEQSPSHSLLLEHVNNCMTDGIEIRWDWTWIYGAGKGVTLSERK